MRLPLILGGLNLASAIPNGKCVPKGTNSGSLAANSTKLAVTILADTNRDGKVDVSGDSDTVGKETWTNEVGALFLANIVDTDRRCSSQITGRCASELGGIFDQTEPPEVPVPDTRLVDPPADDKEATKWYNSLDNDKKLLLLEASTSGKDEYMKVDEVDRKISACNDASDNILRNATYLAPLRTRPIPGLSDSATGTVAVTRAVAARKVRLFHKPAAGGKWEFVTANHTFTAAELKAGLELGIDARDVRRPGGWDGKTTVEFKVKDNEQEAQDSVALRVAPILTQHHGLVTKQLLTTQIDLEGYKDEIQKIEVPPSRRADQEQFAEEFGKVASSLGLYSPMHIFEDCDEKWVQDFFEPGYMSMPGPDGPVSLYIMIRSAQHWRKGGRQVFRDLRSNTVGAVQHLANGETTDSTGNLETVPPHTHNGKLYPAGRVVLGSQDAKKPQIFSFIEAQETQAPIEIDTDWLSVGHTDEFIQFLPANNTLGWVLVADDPLAGLEILRRAKEAGHGKEKASSRPHTPADPAWWYITTTIDDLLGQRTFASEQNTSAAHIERNIEVLKRETGLTDADIIRLPGMYTPDLGYFGVEDPWVYEEKSTNGSTQVSRRADDGEGRTPVLSVLEAGTPPSQRKGGAAGARSPERRGRSEESVNRGAPQQKGAAPVLSVLEAGTPPSQRKSAARAKSRERRQSSGESLKVGALYPSTINSVVVDGKNIIAANPWGPVIDGRDIMAAATEEAYAKAGYKVYYVDDWFSHHTVSGEVHCGTNAVRHLPENKWW